MPSIRIGFGTDFNLISRQVGIGTTIPTSRVDVRGQILSDNSAGSGGVSTITRYDGFLNTTQGIGNTVSIAQTTKGNLNSLSGEIVIPSGREVSISTSTPITGGRIDSLTVTSTFDLPHGGIADREETPEKGTTRFNEDLKTIEFYTGVDWRPVNYYSDGGGRGRGVFGGGGTPSSLSGIDFITISTIGNAITFGNLSQANSQLSACSSETRGVFGGGTPGSATGFDTIEYVTIASAGNVINFGQLTTARRMLAACSSSTRGVFAGGVNPTAIQSTIDYITIATTGNATSFGSLSIARRTQNGSCSSSTRGIFNGGASPSYVNTMEYITIASTGNAINFGNPLFTGGYRTGCSNSVRGLFANGALPTGYTNSIEYVTIASVGNSIYFGDLTISRHGASSAASSIRAVWAGGADASNYYNTIDYITIASTGNAINFGSLTYQRVYFPGCSDSHGGLGGF